MTTEKLQSTIVLIRAECHRAIELGEKATPPPWGTEETCATAWVGPMRTNGDGKVAAIVCGLPINDDLKPEYSARNLSDARFIANSRTFTPKAARALLVMLDALKNIVNVDYEDYDEPGVGWAREALQTLASQWLEDAR